MNIADKNFDTAGGKLLAPRFAGAWYDSDPELLARMIDADLDAAGTSFPESVRALILPHAGYVFSGRVAAAGAAAVRNRRYSRVVVMAPSHRVTLSQSVVMPDALGAKTPLGVLGLDVAAMLRLGQSPYFDTDAAAFEGEHAIEIQLPVLQRALGEFSLLPLIVGHLDGVAADGVAAELLKVIDRDTLVVVSSDFTHYGKSFGFQPFGDPVAENIRQLDDGAFDAIVRRDRAGFSDYCERTGATICGRHPISVLLAMLPDDACVQRIAYSTSGESTGDFSHCVSYLAAAVVLPSGWRTQDSAAATQTDAVRVELAPDDRRALLGLARQAIEFYLKRGRAPTPADLRFEPTPAMQVARGAFVSLHLPGRALRGCIGEIQPRRPLVEAVVDNAIRAAFHDPRFPALTKRELAVVTIEISALTPPRPVSSISDMETGRHGIVLEKCGAAAVFLPQVAPEQGWSLEQTLSHLSLKAGLPADAWQRDARFSVFEADVFSEPDK